MEGPMMASGARDGASHGQGASDRSLDRQAQPFFKDQTSGLGVGQQQPDRVNQLAHQVFSSMISLIRESNRLKGTPAPIDFLKNNDSISTLNRFMLELGTASALPASMVLFRREIGTFILSLGRYKEDSPLISAFKDACAFIKENLGRDAPPTFSALERSVGVLSTLVATSIQALQALKLQELPAKSRNAEVEIQKYGSLLSEIENAFLLSAEAPKSNKRIGTCYTKLTTALLALTNLGSKEQVLKEILVKETLVDALKAAVTYHAKVSKNDCVQRLIGSLCSDLAKIGELEREEGSLKPYTALRLFWDKCRGMSKAAIELRQSFGESSLTAREIKYINKLLAGRTPSQLAESSIDPEREKIFLDHLKTHLDKLLSRLEDPDKRPTIAWYEASQLKKAINFISDFHFHTMVIFQGPLYKDKNWVEFLKKHLNIEGYPLPWYSLRAPSYNINPERVSPELDSYFKRLNELGFYLILFPEDDLKLGNFCLHFLEARKKD